jgi:SecD/SecF fusion protein
VSRRSNYFFVTLIIVALVGVGLLAIPGSPMHKEPTLGLDLQGGLEVTLQAQPPANRELTEEDLDRSVEIMRERVDKLGTTEPEIRKQDPDQINIALPGIENPRAAAAIIGKTAQLELFDLEKNLIAPSVDAQGFPVATASIFDLLAGQQSKIRNNQADSWYLFNADKKLVGGPFSTRQAALDSKALAPFDGKVPTTWRLFGTPPESVVISCAAGEICPNGIQGTVPAERLFYLFRYDPENAENPVPEMTGEHLNLDGTRQDFDTRTNEPIVTMQFTDRGEDIFSDVTRDIAQRGRFKSNLPSSGGQTILQHFAIVLDREIRSWPTIDWTENPNGIGGTNGAQISGDFTVGEAKDLALVLQTGALPVKFVTLEQSEVSATLGEDSLKQALRAAVAGLILVAIFLLIFYRFLGVVAVFGLGVYAALMYAVIVLFDVTLTLPGFAGMILSIGVAADANIVIFERIKEEARAGRSVRAAIATGYRKGFATIVDANVVTAIAAMVLFAVATAGVRGFAFLLLLGTGISIVTAVFATRALLGLLAGFEWFDNPKFMGASTREIPRWQRIDIVGRRRIWFTIAGVLIAISILSLVVKGLNLGIDFDGGSRIAFTTPESVQVEDVRAEAGSVDRASAQIQGRGPEQADGGFRQFTITTESLPPAEQAQLVSALEREFQAQDVGTRNVSASFSEQILRGAIYSLVVSFVLIAGYVAVRFEWRYAVPILRTILNDGLIAIGIYSISGREVTAATVAAFLTIIGYSIYDTIIIFDRVRENVGLMKRSSFAHITNVSLWETIPRSLATTVIVLLPVSTLLLFGGDTLKDFAFAIFVGISISAFSTIFIAAPFLCVLKEHEPEYARRKDAGAAEAVSVGGVRMTEPEPAPEPEPEAEPEDELVPMGTAGTTAGDGGSSTSPQSSAKRERRRQRRSSRPHGRSR